MVTKQFRFSHLFGAYPLGYSAWDKIRAIYWRLRGCDHQTGMCIDLGDEDRGQLFYCFRCCKYPGHEYDK